MEELTEAKARWKIRRVDFEDDIFTVDKKWIRAFLGEYKREIDVPFHAIGRAQGVVMGMGEVGMSTLTNGWAAAAVSSSMLSPVTKPTDQHSRRGYSTADLRKICGGNAMRVLRAVEEASRASVRP